MYPILFMHSFVDGHLGCFHILTIVNNAVMNVRMHISFQVSVFIFFFRYIPSNGAVGSYGSSVFSFFGKPPFCFS